jgi:uncharacterized membrane protein YcjF (UPF0283 family)
MAQQDDTNNKFNSKQFNSDFEDQKQAQIELNKQLDEEKLAQMNNINETKSLTQMTLSDIFIGIKNSWFDLFDDMLSQRFKKDMFTKKNRLYFVGITFLIIGIILYFYDFFVSEDDNIKIVEKVVEIRHIVDKSNDGDNIGNMPNTI